MTELEILKARIAVLEKKNERLLAFTKLMRDFFYNDKSGHGIYILSQAQNALNDVGEPPELWRGYDGREVKSH